MAIRLDQKRPNEVRDYTYDWSKFLDGDAIETSAWAVEGISKDSDSNGVDTVTIRVSGGAEGAFARLTNTITTVGGRTESEDFALIIREADEPVTLEEARRHLRVDSDVDDREILESVVSAREWVEDYTGLVLVRRRVTERLLRLDGRSTLSAWPVSEVDPVTIAYVDRGGAEQVIATATIRAYAPPARLMPAVGSRWPLADIAGAVDVTFTAGFATAAEVPAICRQAMLILITAYYENRAGEDFAAAEAAARSLLRGRRRRGL